ncbi:response regulator [Fulvimarina endophytica]|uniref:Response regulator n=2 Tax=Fulvimarina endophytica TaxID=2293836 RepID=A0A371XA03_9HYPH|nr:response regulator [Fulvimarina endophytica]
MTAKPQTVLVVEDEPLLRMDVVETLEDAGYDVIEAVDADQALAVLEATDGVGILLTDVYMPGSIDGLELAHRVHREWQGIAIVVVSGHQRFSADELPAGALFLSKPYGPTAIVDLVGQIRTAS